MNPETLSAMSVAAKLRAKTAAPLSRFMRSARIAKIAPTAPNTTPPTGK
jgi:hypothetical protein